MNHHPFLDIQKVTAQEVIGQESAVEQILVALIAGGHLLLEGPPGVGKTKLAQTIASLLDLSFSRVQFTPDLMPADITGLNILDPKSGTFKFCQGPVFADVLLADEINRAPARTQSALLEAMQEKQVTVDGKTTALSSLFTVIATQNPLEYEGTFGLPEAQLDRFFIKVRIGLPSMEQSRAILEAMHVKKASEHQPLVDASQMHKLRQEVQEVLVDESLIDYVTNIIHRTRDMPYLRNGLSPRSSIMLLQAAKALAVLRERTYVLPEDVQEMAYPVLGHRLHLSPEATIQGMTAERCLEEVLKSIAVPKKGENA